MPLLPIDQFYAFASYEHDRLWQGEVPLWNPHTYAGHPFLADVQSAVFYPLSLVTMLVSGPGPFSPRWLQVEAVVHQVLGAVFTYVPAVARVLWLRSLLLWAVI